MDEKKDYIYYVVYLLGPHYHFVKNVCIPHSWIILRNKEAVLIKYPIEDLVEINERVRNRENFLEDWDVLEANIKYGTDTYDDAQKHITVLNNILLQERAYMKIANEDYSSVSEDRNSELDSSNTEINEPEQQRKQFTASSDSAESTAIKTVSNQAPTDDLSSESNEKPTELNDTTSSANESRKYYTRQARNLSQHQKDEQLYSTSERSSDQNYTNIENSGDKPNDYIENDANIRCSNGKELPVGSDTTKATDESLNQDKHKEHIFGTEFVDMLKEMRSHVHRSAFIVDQIRIQHLKHLSMIEQMIEYVEDYNKTYTDDPISTTTKAMAAVDVQEKAEKNEDNEIDNAADWVKGKRNEREVVKQRTTERESKHEAEKVIEDDVYGASEHEYKRKDNPQKISRVISREFTLPPEYDKDNPKWTLKYREKVNGLVELLPDSGVYVHRIRLGRCLIESTDSKTLARKLTWEVFSENALKTCSISGRKRTFNKKPGLDKHAMMVLLDYVDQHAHTNNWPKIDTPAILTSIRNKIHSSRCRPV